MALFDDDTERLLSGPFCATCKHSESHHKVWPNYPADQYVCEICYLATPGDPWHVFTPLGKEAASFTGQRNFRDSVVVGTCRIERFGV